MASLHFFLQDIVTKQTMDFAEIRAKMFFWTSSVWFGLVEMTKLFSAEYKKIIITFYGFFQKCFYKDLLMLLGQNVKIRE